MRCLAAAFAAYEASYTTAAYADTVPTVDGIEARLRQMVVLVAETGGVIVGTIAHSIPNPGEGHLRGMAVDPGSQGQGIAEALLQAAERELHDAGCVRVTLDTTRPLQRAIRFYQRSGYRASGIVRDFFGMPLVEYEKRVG